jgi:hypothetical protein
LIDLGVSFLLGKETKCTYVPSWANRAGVPPPFEFFEWNVDMANDLLLVDLDAVLDGEDEVVLERLGGDEHVVLVPAARGQAGDARPGLVHLRGDPGAHEDLADARLVDECDVAGLDDVDAHVPEARHGVLLAADVRGQLGVHGERGVGVHRQREALVGLRAEPHGHHHLAPALRLLVEDVVPLRRERAVGRHAERGVGQVEAQAADEVVLGEALALEHDVQERGLDPLPREREHVVPLRARRLLDVPRGAGVAPELHLRERVEAASPLEVPRLEDAHVQVLHPLHEVVPAGPPAGETGSRLPDPELIRWRQRAEGAKPRQDAGHPCSRRQLSSWKGETGLCVRKELLCAFWPPNDHDVERAGRVG